MTNILVDEVALFSVTRLHLKSLIFSQSPTGCTFVFKNEHFKLEVLLLRESPKRKGMFVTFQMYRCYINKLKFV